MPHCHTRLYDYTWMFSNNFSHRAEPVLVSFSEGNRISIFLWRKKKKKTSWSAEGFTIQNWISKLNIAVGRAWEHAQSQGNRAFLLWKCVTLLISSFTLFPTSSLNSVWWYIWLVVISLFMMMFWGLNQLNLEAACWPLTNFCFLITSHLKSLRVNRDALLHASF